MATPCDSVEDAEDDGVGGEVQRRVLGGCVSFDSGYSRLRAWPPTRGGGGGGGGGGEEV
eukprot:COSAG03_NODE_722_length_6101_cov_3031.874209_4_plen_59_part_00